MQLSITAFDSLPDPRAENVRHDLGEILIIAFIASRSGCGGQVGMWIARRERQFGPASHLFDRQRYFMNARRIGSNVAPR